jgi:hypothetical protein
MGEFAGMNLDLVDLDLVFDLDSSFQGRELWGFRT